MLNPDPPKPSNIEESKEKKVDINKETEITVDDAKKAKANESSAHVIRMIQNSNAHTGKYAFLYCSVIFNAIRTLFVAY